MIADPRSVALRWPGARVRVLAELALVASETPWAFSRMHLERARGAGLSDEDLVHAIALSSYFGHLNRVADAVGQPLDYEVRHVPPHAEPATPALAVAPAAIRNAPALDLASRPATAEALAAWRTYVMERETPLPRATRTAIASWVAALLGDGSTQAASAVAGLDRELRDVVETVTLAPWRLGASTFATLRARDYDDRALFDVVTVASTQGVVSRIAVSLAALAR